MLAMSVENAQLGDYILTENRSNFLFLEGSTAWLKDCPQFPSPLYGVKKCFDRIAINYEYSVLYIDPITRQAFNYDTPMSCDNNPQNIIAIDIDNKEHHCRNTNLGPADKPFWIERTSPDRARSKET